MPTAFVLSNVGRVEALPEANGVRVDEVSFALCPMAHQPLFVAASTWGGRLTLNVVHDAGRLAPRGRAGRSPRPWRRCCGRPPPDQPSGFSRNCAWMRSTSGRQAASASTQSRSRCEPASRASMAKASSFANAFL